MTSSTEVAGAERARSFSDDCMDAARAFIQTILVVDDQARLLGVAETPPSNPALLTPPGRRGRGALERSDEPVAKPDAELDLNVRELISASVEQGVMCSVYPIDQSVEGLVERVSKTARAADIVTLDWRMNGDDGRLCRDIIVSILKQDLDDGGVLRLIAIYTGEIDLPAIARSIHQAITDQQIGQIHLDETELVITGPHTRISLFLKNHASRTSPELEEKRVDEGNLPGQLIKEYATISAGLLTNVALASIAAVRRYTPRLLAKYRPDLDLPYLAHRASIPNPEDAIGYAKDLVAAELRAAISGGDDADKFASDEATLRRLRYSPIWRDEPFQIRWRKGDAESDPTYQVEREEFERLFVEEKNERIKLSDMITPQPNTKAFRIEDILCALTADYAIAESLKMEFAFKSKVMSTKDLSRSKVYLTNGVIVKGDDENYLMCIQPSCDCVRIPAEGRSFFFISLKPTKEARVDCILQNAEKVFDGFLFNRKAYELQAISFKPSDGRTMIEAAADESGEYSFLSDEGERWMFLGVMKADFVYRASQIIAGDLCRIGVDEFELVRRK